MQFIKSYRCQVLCLLLLASFCSSLYAQNGDNPVSNSDIENRKLHVYVSGFPDISFLSDKIDFALFVEDKAKAQVTVYIEERSTDSGQKEFIISYSGRKELKGISDELSHVPQPGETEENTKQALVTILEVALIKYAARTPAGEDISIKYSHTEEQVAAVKDKWNYWLFSLNFHFNLNRAKSLKGNNFSGGFSARRITDAWIMRASFHTSYNENTYDIEEIDLAYTNITRNHNFHGLVVKSLGDHWSVGSFIEASQVTYYNNKFSFEFAPAVEFSIFPYVESEQRSFTFMYRLGYIYRQYWEETIYGKTEEGLIQTSLMADIEIIKDWGRIESSLTGSTYLQDFSKNRLTWSFEFRVRVFEQLTFDVDWRVSRIHDQIFLEREGASLEEVLLRRKRLKTHYDYSIEFGFGYSFGSLKSAIVNPIFGN